MIQGLIQRSVISAIALFAAGAFLIGGAGGSTGTAQATSGGPPECDEPGLVAPADDQGGVAGFSIGIAGQIVAVCVATEDGHSSLVEEDGLVLDDCVGVTGIGSSQVQVIRAPDCAALTHIDVFYLPVEDVPVLQQENPLDGTEDEEVPADEEPDDGVTEEAPLTVT